MDDEHGGLRARSCHHRGAGPRLESSIECGGQRQERWRGRASAAVGKPARRPARVSERSVQWLVA